MIILYIMLVAYILSINFYSFLLVKSLRDEEKKAELERQAAPLVDAARTSAEKPLTQYGKNSDRSLGKLCIAGALGGAVTIYICMFLFKYKRANLLLMVLMPLLGVLNIYLFVLLFRSGFGFLVIR